MDKSELKNDCGVDMIPSGSTLVHWKDPKITALVLARQTCLLGLELASELGLELRIEVRVTIDPNTYPQH
jgi:hypothetical protein